MEKLSKYLKAEKADEWSLNNGGFYDGKWLAKDLKLHTNEGYKLVECPTEVKFTINKLMLRDKIVDISKSFKIWIISANIKGMIDLGNRELDDLLDKGLINIRFENGKIFIYLEI